MKAVYYPTPKLSAPLVRPRILRLLSSAMRLAALRHSMIRVTAGLCLATFTTWAKALNCIRIIWRKIPRQIIKTYRVKAEAGFASYCSEN